MNITGEKKIRRIVDVYPLISQLLALTDINSDTLFIPFNN